MDVTLAGSGLTRNWSDAELQGISIGLEAFDGQIGSSTVPIPDPAGGDEVPPGSALVIEEGSTLLLSGIVISEGRSRGFEPTNPNKLDSYTVDDPNTFLYGFRVAGWVRPEETDYARIQAFFDDFLPAITTTQVLNTSTTTMVAATYDSDGVADIMRDAIDITGKTLFLHDLAAGGICAHWHALTGGHACGLTIDDSDPSVNGPTDWLPQNPSRVRDGTDLANDILAYGSADLLTPVLVQDATSIAAYDVDGKRHQTFARFPEATDLATLTLDANRLLETNKDPRDTWTCTIGPLDATALANIRVGDIITCTSTVMTLSAEPQRIASMRLSVAGAQRVAPTLWMAELTLGAPVRGPKGRATARPPVLQPAAPSIFNGSPACFADRFHRTGSGLGGGWTGSESAFVDVSTNGSSGVVFFDSSGPFAALASMTYQTAVPAQVGEYGATATFTMNDIPPSTAGFVFQDVDLGDFAVTCEINNLLAGADGTILVETPSSSDLYFVTEWAPGSHSIHVVVRPGIGVFVYVTVSGHETAAITVTDATVAGGTTAVGVSTQLTNLDTTDWTLLFNSLIFDGCAPASGQVVPLELIATSDGAETDYATAFAYRPGSLEIIVGGIPWESGGWQEVDPAVGSWEFLQVPVNGNVIRAEYVAA